MKKFEGLAKIQDRAYFWSDVRLALFIIGGLLMGLLVAYLVEK